MEKINPDKFYSMKEVLDNGWLPFRSKKTVVKYAQRGALKLSYDGDGKGRRYLIKGSNIVDFLNNLATGRFN